MYIIIQKYLNYLNLFVDLSVIFAKKGGKVPRVNLRTFNLQPLKTSGFLILFYKIPSL